VKKGLIFSFLLLFMPLFAAAQVANNTSLVGTVSDSSGAVIAGAKVAAINEDTKVEYDAITNAEGYYTVTGNINAGMYDVVVDSNGFQKYKKTGVTVVLNQAARTDFALKAGSATTEVTVSANTPAIQTDDPLLGETVGTEMVEDLPSNGRNALQLANIASNVSVSTGSALTGLPPGITASGAGTRGVNNDITLDGISIMNNLGTTVFVVPDPDTLDSVQTTNGNYTAQYGNYIGIHINESTRSGTNKYHGEIYDFLQNDDLNSRGFNRNTIVPGKNPVRYNLFGGLADGPVVIPHLYNGRDKTFFMGSYEGLRQHTVNNSFSQVFTPAEKEGDFSQLLSFGTGAGQSGTSTPQLIFSPLDGHAYYRATGNVIDMAGNTVTCPCQVIDDYNVNATTGQTNGGATYSPNPGMPTSMLANRAIALNILKYNAAPNQTGTPLNENNYSSIPTVEKENESNDRVDEVFNEKQRIFGRYDWQYVNQTSEARDLTSWVYNPNDDRNLAFGYTWIIKPTLVNDLRGGFNWLKTSQLDYFAENGPSGVESSLGLPSPFVTQAGDPGLPDVSGLSSYGNGEDNWVQDDRTYQLYDQIAYTHNKHSFLAGFELRRLMIGRAAQNQPCGALGFSSNDTLYQNVSQIPTTGICGTPPSPTTPYWINGAPKACTYGSGDASFITGVANTTETPVFQVKEQVEQWRQGFFVQDTWQVSKKMTLDLGFRYELPQVPTSANGYARLLDPTYSFLIPTSTATTAASYTPSPGLALTAPNHKDFGPHVGFAYRLTDKVTFRGGGGIYYNANQMNAYTLMSGNYPLASSQNFSSPAQGTQNSTTPYLTLAAPTTGGGSAAPAGTCTPTCAYDSAYSVAYHLPQETMYQWNLDLGYELWKNAGIEFQYLGSHSIHLNTNFYPNQPQPVGANYIVNGAPVTSSTSGANNLNLRRPDQNFGQIRVADNIASAGYNGLTTVFRQRLSRGVTANLSYTWSHAMDESSDANSGGTCMYQGPNAYAGGTGDCKIDWGNASADVRHKVVGSVTWQLPKFQHQNIILQEFAGGWQINGIVTLASGAPININFSGTDWAAVGVPQSGAGQRPNWVHKGSMTCNKQKLLSEPYGTNGVSCMDITAYAAPARFTYGNLHRNDIYGPGSLTNNISLFKNFKLVGSASLQFRIEAFNAFNHSNIGTPGNITLTPTALSTTFTNPNYVVGSLAPSSGSSAFGYPTSSGAGRTGQVSAKLSF
jgi:hypothetical protein